MANDSYALGLDVGGTASRWTVVDRTGVALASGAASPFTGHVFNDAARKLVTTAIAEIARSLRKEHWPCSLVAGITGLPMGSAEAAFFVDAFAQGLGIEPSRITVADDLWIAYQARFKPGEGILVYSGTGSVAFHLSSDGKTERAGGHGFMVDDHGSAFWIAIEAIRRILVLEDRRPGSGWATPLGQALAREIGTAEWGGVRAFLYGGDRGRTGLLAQTVAAEARRGNDEALRLLNEAGTALADLALALRGRLGNLPVALAGGASWLHTEIPRAFAIRLGDKFTHDEIDAALSAARLALRLI